MPATPERAPSDFAEILATPELPLIVGGQAVNIWAYFYAPTVPLLDKYAPFVSKDADIYGTRALAQALAQRAGWECRFEEKKDSIVVAILRKVGTPEEAPLTIEVLNQVNGLTEADLALDTILEFEAMRYRIPPPPVLLKAKLYNLASLFWSDRPQDLKHARMLVEMAPYYLNEMHADCRAGRVSEATLVAAVNYLADVVTAGFAGNAARAHGLDLARVFPSSLWLSGAPTLHPVVARLKAHGLAPPADSSSPEFSPD